MNFVTGAALVVIGAILAVASVAAGKSVWDVVASSALVLGGVVYIAVMTETDSTK